MGKKKASSLKALFLWVRRLPTRVKALLGAAIAVFAVVALKFLVKSHDHFYIASEAIHAAGIFVLVYKLTTQKTCSGLSLKSQELTALFLGVRLVCSAIIELDIHTVLDVFTLVATLWVIFTIRFKLKSTYTHEFDTVPLYYLMVPSAIMALLVKPFISGHAYVTEVLWAFCVYLESVSVWPQLRLMQNAKMIEPFTSHYVFALGVARFLSCANWIIRVYETGGRHFYLVASGYYNYLWFPAAFLAEIVQTFILADFCYYYMKSFLEGQLLVRIPV